MTLGMDSSTRQPRDRPFTSSRGSIAIVPPREGQAHAAPRVAFSLGAPAGGGTGRASTGRVPAVERGKDLLAIRCRDALAGVGDREDNAIAHARSGQRDRRRAILGRILDEIPERTAVPADRRRSR